MEAELEVGFKLFVERCAGSCLCTCLSECANIKKLIAGAPPAVYTKGDPDGLQALCGTVRGPVQSSGNPHSQKECL